MCLCNKLIIALPITKIVMEHDLSKFKQFSIFLEKSKTISLKKDYNNQFI